MKKLFSNLMLVAAAAMAFFACQKSEVEAPKYVEVNGLSFSSEKPELSADSRTEWTGKGIQWSKGDVIRVAYTCDGVWQNADGTATAEEVFGKKTSKLYASTQLAATSATAKFAVPKNFKGTASGVYEFYAIYPSGAAVEETDFPFAPSVTVNIPVEQTPLANSFDSDADLMAAKSVETFEGLPTESISLLWTRIVAHGHLTLKNLQVEDGEKLQRITLTADEEADMVGEHYLYLDTYNVVKPKGNSAANSLTVKANNLTIAEGGNVTFWTCFLPCTWKSLYVVVETDKATYTRSIDLTGNEKTFAQNARNTLGINMVTAVREAKTAIPLPFVKEFSANSGTAEITELDGFSSIDGKVYNADKAIRLASGDLNGSITTQPLDLSQNFHVIVTACGWDSGELKMTVSAGDQTNNITLTTYGADQKPGTWTDYVINFDPVGSIGTVQFSAVKDNRYYIQKIQILEGHVELTPVLSATNPGEMSAEGGAGSFKYTLSNPKDGKTVSATENSDWIENLAVNQEAKTVSYNVAENTSEESRTATITLSYEGAESVTVTVSQAGKTAENESGWIATSFANLKDGDQVVIVSTKESFIHAMSNNNGTGSAPTAVAVGYSDNKLSSEPEETIVWHIGVDGDKRIFYTDSGKTKWLYCTNSNNGVRVGTNTNKTFAWDSNYLKHVSNNRYIGVYNEQDWRCYTSINNYITGQTFTFFVKQGGSSAGGETPEPEPEQPTLSPRNLEFSAATATATMGQAFTAPTLSGDKMDDVQYSSSNTAVAIVNASTGDVTLVSAGTTTITASAPATTQYEAGEDTYTLTVNASSPGVQQTTTTYTFDSKSWGDSTQSWTSGKDGDQYTSDQGVQVTSKCTGANATCKTTLSNVSSVEVSYCTNKTAGEGSITIAIGSVTKTVDVVKSGSDGRTLKTLTLDFSSELPSGTPKITVACSTNSVYINALTFTHTN